jgi:phospholipase C
MRAPSTSHARPSPGPALAGTGLPAHAPAAVCPTGAQPPQRGHREVTARHDNAGGNLRLTLTNPGARRTDLTITNAYSGARVTLGLEAYDIVDHVIDLGTTNRWYDITIVLDADRVYLWRLTGHVENGGPGASDPAIITD